MSKFRIIYIMGVSGSGKSTIGKLLSEKTGWRFFDGDDFHPQENIDKMKAGSPLTDQDRQVWLEKLNDLAKLNLDNGPTVIVCSALKIKYRNILQRGISEVTKFVYLKGPFDLISQRLESRAGHFMPKHLLQSQFDTLEEPFNAITIDINDSQTNIVNRIIFALGGLE